MSARDAEPIGALPLTRGDVRLIAEALDNFRTNTFVDPRSPNYQNDKSERERVRELLALFETVSHRR